MEIFEVEVTDEVVAVLERAHDEAIALGHGYVGTEHVLIALAARHGSPITPDRVRSEVRAIFDENTWNRHVPDADSLASVGVDLDKIRTEAEAEFGEGVLLMPPHVGFTRRFQSLLREAGANGSSVDPVRLLGAITADKDSVAAKVLQRLGVSD